MKTCVAKETGNIMHVVSCIYIFLNNSMNTFVHFSLGFDGLINCKTKVKNGYYYLWFLSRPGMVEQFLMCAGLSLFTYNLKIERNMLS